MAAIFDALPGLDTPVGDIQRNLDSMWEDTADQGRPAPISDDAKATQVNFVLHLGWGAAADDAAAQFQTAVNFSRRYPCRVVVLCPEEETAAAEMRAKIYGECTIGKSRDDRRCCEFVILGYPPSLRPYLENQVSVCLSSDLPLYYWAHGFSDNSRLADYRYLLTRSKRVLIDSAIAPADALSYPWPKPEAVRDLACARLLPVRQALGQFLSRYSISAIADGLRSATVTHGSHLAAESKVLLDWLRERLNLCGASSAKFATSASAALPPGGLTVTLDYAAKKSFSWTGDVGTGRAQFEADFGSGRSSLAAAVSLLPPENALSEAMFF